MVAVVSTAGVVDWSLTLSSALSTSFRVPLITALTDGTFIVAWESIDWVLGESAIVAHRVDSDGFLFWGSVPQTLDYSPGEFDVGPEVTATTDGAFVLTWVRDGATGLTPHDLFAQKFDGGPTAQWNGGQPLLIDDSDDTWEEHRVIADNAGGVAITWERWAAGEARVQWLTTTGFERFGFEGLRPAQPSGLTERLPSITFLGPEQLLVVWCADQGATFGGVFAQLISESGQWQWGLDGVTVAPVDGLLETDVRVAGSSDRGRVAYFAPPAAGMDEQLHVIEVDATGALTWSQPAVACAISSSKADLTILSGADDSSYITWSEDRLGGANQDVFAQNVNPDGSLGPPPARFVRGECSGDGVYDITDAIVLLAHLFGTAPLPNCPDACDRDDDGALVVTDVIWMLGELFGGGFVPPPAPGCNADTTPDSLDCPTPSACP